MRNEMTASERRKEKPTAESIERLLALMICSEGEDI